MNSIITNRIHPWYLPPIVKLDAELAYGSTTDTDKDGLTDIEELGSTTPVKKYNAADYVSKLTHLSMPSSSGISKKYDIYVYNYNSNPVEEDTDGDLDLDNIDPHPKRYQLNDLLCYNMSKLNDLAIEYKNNRINDLKADKYYETSEESWLTLMFIRKFNNSYTSEYWDCVGGEIENGFILYVIDKNYGLYQYFNKTENYYATASGEIGDLYHMAATATGYIYKSNYGDGVKHFGLSATGVAYGMMPESYINNLSGWAGDLQTAMNNAYNISNRSNDYDIFKEIMSNLIGYDKNITDIYSGYDHSFDIDDMYGDTDGYNIYKLLTNGETLEEALLSYFKKGYLKRYSEFTNNWSETEIRNVTYTYTKNKFLNVVRWPLFKYDFKSNQSEAARDAFTEFILERIKYE